MFLISYIIDFFKDPTLIYFGKIQLGSLWF
jgi:hypothetical protein